MNKLEITEFLKNIKLDDSEISDGLDNGVYFLYVELPEGRKATIKKLLAYGFKFRIRIKEDYKFYKQFSMKISQ